MFSKTKGNHAKRSGHVTVMRPESCVQDESFGRGYEWEAKCSWPLAGVMYAFLFVVYLYLSLTEFCLRLRVAFMRPCVWEWERSVCVCARMWIGKLASICMWSSAPSSVLFCVFRISTKPPVCVTTSKNSFLEHTLIKDRTCFWLVLYPSRMYPRTCDILITLSRLVTWRRHYEKRVGLDWAICDWAWSDHVHDANSSKANRPPETWKQNVLSSHLFLLSLPLIFSIFILNYFILKDLFKLM